MPKTYDPVLVVLSTLIAIWASYDALQLAGRLGAAGAQARPVWLAAGSLAQGIGIWSMHFVAMLALRLPVSVSYSVALVTLSVLMAVAASAVAFAIVSREVMGRRSFLLGGACLGAAIAGMHYTAMNAMRLPGAMRYDPRLVILSIAIAIAASVVALRFAFQLRTASSRSDALGTRGPALALGLGIAAMHYTAMAAVQFTPAPLGPGGWSGVVPATPQLATVVALGTAAMLGMAQLGIVISRREEQVRQGEERFRLVVEQVQEYAILTLDLHGRVVSWNAGAQRIEGYEAREILGQHFSRFYPAEDIAQEKPERQLQAAAAQGWAKDEGWRVRKDGSRFWANTLITAIRDATGALVGFSKVTRDITQHRRAEAELARYRGQLRALAARIEAAREDERTTIARELHDELGQALTVLRLDLSSLGAKVPKRSPRARKIHGMIGLLDDTLEAMRRVAAELRPPLLDQLGLGAAIRSLAQDFETRTGVSYHVQIEGEDEELDEMLAAAVYRMLQEALTNVVRHARATRVDITLRVTAREVELEVRDNGRGISEQELADQRSLGLLGMRERAQSWGGEVSITGAPGQGTIVRIRIPRREQVEQPRTV